MLGLLLAGVLLATAEPWRPAARPATNAIVLLFAAAVMALGFVPLLPVTWRRRFVRRRAPKTMGLHVVHVRPDAIAVEQDGIERRFGWGTVQAIRAPLDLVVVDLPDRRVVLPDRLFASSEDRDACLGAMRRAHRAARHATRSRRGARPSDPFAPPRSSEP